MAVALAVQADSSGLCHEAVRCGFDDFIFTAVAYELTCMMLLDQVVQFNCHYLVSQKTLLQIQDKISK